MNVHPIQSQTVNQTLLIGQLESLEFQVRPLKDEEQQLKNQLN